MPVEIKELVIRSKVTSSVVASSEQNSVTQLTGDLQPVGDSMSNNDAIIQDCVRQVLRILKKKEER